MMADMPEHIREFLGHAAWAQGGHEICGFILQDWGILFISNVSDVEGEFEMHPPELLAAHQNYGKLLIGVFHSHPSGRVSPSNTDIDYAPQGLRYWIVTPDEVVEWDMTHDVPRQVS